MIKQIYFVTTNHGKFEEVRQWINQIDPEIVLEQAALEIPEYQSLDVVEVSRGKALEAWKILKKPLLIDDGGLYIEKYNKFPGTLSKYVFEGIGLEGIWLLGKDDPRAYFLTCLVYCDGPDSIHYFSEKSEGTLIKPQGINSHKQLPYSAVFIPKGCDVTFAELRATEREKQFHHRYKAVVAWLNWLKGN